MTTDILELPELRERIARYTVEVYEGMPERNENGRRTELIRGIVIEKIPMSPLHATIAKLLYDRVMALAPSGFTVRQDHPLRLADSMPEPDLAVVVGHVRDFYDRHPHTAELVVEIAVTTLALDRANAALYAENGVQEYWIVIPKQQCVEVYRDPQDGAFLDRQVYAADQTVTCKGVPAITLRISDILSP